MGAGAHSCRASQTATLHRTFPPLGAPAQTSADRREWTIRNGKFTQFSLSRSHRERRENFPSPETAPPGGRNPSKPPRRFDGAGTPRVSRLRSRAHSQMNRLSIKLDSWGVLAGFCRGGTIAPQQRARVIIALGAVRLAERVGAATSPHRSDEKRELAASFSMG